GVIDGPDFFGRAVEFSLIGRAASHITRPRSSAPLPPQLLGRVKRLQERRNHDQPMNMKPTNELSERERRILRELERDLERRHIDPVQRLVLAAVLVAVGALFTLAAFPVSLLAATAGLATMGVGIG